ncbi:MULTISPECIES: chloramphenicol phosphotransferase CPT family protein [Rossellomorea]|uniref:chloramphenicol phosphotransferase CPT family protein n=1 Tax=Rossellomorea TaxID=2837508 RepID=UPI001E4AE1DC|nr:MULTISPECIES: AAA family ATPase [Rossellomorea]MCC5801253.1 AAA family ATPase [Rossellomorea vietnamensis]UTE76624.1 AAA family ATPase [Rossellomorea sp. KS-H15a]
MTNIIILNGGSSSGKTTLARYLQNSLTEPWLRFGIDDLIKSMPEAMLKKDSGLTFNGDGSVHPGTEFQKLETAWMHGIGEMARRGARIIIDDVFLSGVKGREKWETALDGLQVLWVGVFCDPDVAAAREKERGDRIEGMAVSQATIVHKDMNYDVKVDTSKSSAEGCIRLIKQKV